jgi:hypothetical protein
MNRRRVARRVALCPSTRIALGQAEIARSLATKVWRYTLPSVFGRAETGRPWVAELAGGERRSVERSGHGHTKAGVWLSALEGTRRRVVWHRPLVATLLITHSLVTKEKKKRTRALHDGS